MILDFFAARKRNQIRIMLRIRIQDNPKCDTDPTGSRSERLEIQLGADTRM